jgi:Pyruvate/2-oxoacid:ferredoxin oxidoreductase gamma subunit
VEREVILTGVGGMGVQLAAQILARAAVREDRHVTLLGTYGGTMRGGNTEATLIVGDDPLATPPIVSQTGAAIVVHPQFWAEIHAKLRPGALVVLNADATPTEVDRQAHRVLEVSAAELGVPQAASLVLAGAWARASGVVGVESLVEAMRESVPSYRQQHLERNEAALRAGFAAVPAGAA